MGESLQGAASGSDPRSRFTSSGDWWRGCLPQRAHSLLATSCATLPRSLGGGRGAMGSLLSGALSWLIVLAVGLAPMLVYFLAGAIGRAVGRTARGPSAAARQSRRGKPSHRTGRTEAPH